MNEKKPIESAAFESIRVIGKKAQELMHRAKEEREQRKHAMEHMEDLPPPPVSGDEKHTVSVKLSIKSVVQASFAILAIVAGAWLTLQLADVLILLGLAIFVAIIIDPGVRYLERLNLPRGVAILIHYFSALFIFTLLMISLVPIIGIQIHELINILLLKINAFILQPEVHLPFATESINTRLTETVQELLKNVSVHELLRNIENFSSNITAAAQGLAEFAKNLAGSVLSFFVRTVVVLVLAFFIQIEKEGIRTWIRSVLPYHMRRYLDDKSDAIHYKIAQWVRGQLLLAFTIGLLVFIALLILRMKYALTLGALAAFTEFIPYIGPLIGAIPAVLIALTEGGIGWALIIMGVYYVIQWCENNLLVPLIMKRAVGLSPIVIVLAMMTAMSFSSYIHPILGILLAVPFATVVTIFIDDWREHRQKNLK